MVNTHFINLTMFSPLIIASNSSFRRILHNSFSFTGPCISRSIFPSNTANVLSSRTVSVHDSEVTSAWSLSLFKHQHDARSNERKIQNCI